MKKVLLLLLCTWGLFADVRLFNDSPYELKAVIRGADGSFLGEMVLLPEQYNTWSSQGVDTQNLNYSLTPYTVVWYCQEGGVYGICTEVPAGGAAMAQDCAGPRICIPPQNQPNAPAGSQESDQTGDQ